MHPMRTAACGGITPNWLGAAQLKAGGSYPVGLEKTLPPSEVTPSVRLYANRAATYNWYLLLPVLCLRHGRSWSVLSRMAVVQYFRLGIGGIQAWAEGYGGQDVAHAACPRHWQIQRNSRLLQFGARAVAGQMPEPG